MIKIAVYSKGVKVSPDRRDDVSKIHGYIKRKMTRTYKRTEKGDFIGLSIIDGKPCVIKSWHGWFFVHLPKSTINKLKNNGQLKQNIL